MRYCNRDTKKTRQKLQDNLLKHDWDTSESEKKVESENGHNFLEYWGDFGAWKSEQIYKSSIGTWAINS